MKKCLLILPLLFLLSLKVFSQTVYINMTGEFYHTNKCKVYSKNFEAVPLWKARDTYSKKPCQKCNPPTKEVKMIPKKKVIKNKAPVKK
jgi:hypothetical protein